MVASFGGQLKALLWRCVLLKKRNKRQFGQECLLPLYFVSVIVIVKALIKPQSESAIDLFPSHNLDDPNYKINLNKTILISPNTPDVKAIISKLKGILGNFNDTYYATEEEAERVYVANKNEVSAGIILYSTGVNPSYAIRLPYDGIPGTLDTFTDQGGCRHSANGSNSNQCLANRYLTSGFLWLQRALEAAMIDSPIHLPNVSVQMMPKGEFSSDLTIIQTVSAIYFILCFSFFVDYLCTNLVAEKEKKIREGMKMMGLRDSVFWLSWGIIYGVQMLIESIILTVIIYTSGFFDQDRSNSFIFFILMIFYGWSVITLAFMMTPFFKKAQTAAALTGYVTIGAGCLYFLVSLTRDIGPEGYIYSVPLPLIWCLCLVSPVALALGIDQGIYLDNHGGMTFATLTKGTFPQYAPIVMLLVDTILYGLVAYYFDHVIPGEYGPRYAPWYCFMPSYYKQQRASTAEEMSRNSHISSEQGADVEPVSPELIDKAGLRIFQISKIFKGRRGTVKAVQGLSLDMYEGQITALLGHNGAGKTTLINMLCGLTPPSSGFATIYGMDVSHSGDMERIRTMCGVCPQHNILYETLTTKEHLKLFAGIKGVPSHKQEAEIQKAMKDADIFDKADSFAENLSGGQKRKLSVAMALIGDPKIIFLDEPTAGMDPFSRRHLWSLLQKTKKDRIILLSTHFMDEADILADRKAIVSRGQLRCIGSSLFLKNRFGIGYHLDMVVEPKCERSRITETLCEHIPGVQMQRSHAKELAYTLPLQQVSKFSGMFNCLEEKGDGKSKAENLGIRSYGVSMTTLEEVFLKLGEQEEEAELESYEEEEAKSRHISFSNRAFTGSDDRDSGIEQLEEQVSIKMKQDLKSTRDSPHNVRDPNINLTCQRFWALFKMRFLLHRRNPNAVFIGIFFPIFFVSVASVLNKLGDRSIDQSNPVKLSLRNISFKYAATYQEPNVSPLIVLDSQGDETSGQFVSEVNKTWMTELVNGPVNLRDGTMQHFAGFNLWLYNNMNHALTYTALYNDSAVHSLPAIVNLMSSTILALVTNNQSAFIDGKNLPWPSSSKKLAYNGAAFATSLLLGLAFLGTATAFAGHIVQDRQMKVRSQLRVAGVTFHLYWGTIFLFNFIQMCLPVIICVIIVAAVQIDSFNNAGALLSMLLLFTTYLPSIILLSYALSFLFDTFEACQAVMPNFISFTGLIPYVIMSLCDMLGAPHVARTIHYIAVVIFPMYPLPGGIYYIDRVYRVGSIVGQVNLRLEHYFDPKNNIILCIIMPVIHMTISYIVLRVLDVRQTGGKSILSCRDKSKVKDIPDENPDLIEEEDEDVEHERNRVASLKSKQGDGSVGYVQNLRKEFEMDSPSCCNRNAKGKVKVAVRNLTFGVDTGEVFGLLGPNGAGKTTTLNMMIADTRPTRGKVIVTGLDVKPSTSEVFKAMGYCPQHDALWDLITMREHIEFYGLMHGLSPKNSVLVADSLIEGLKVEEHARKKAKKLSGGTKRKLSYAISMLGNPRFVLFDEPSSGMDPQSKRFLWDTISSSFEGSDRGAILTTHYMEEADALCSRVGIMVNGQLECLGPTQHLKDKYGSGYLLEIKLKHASLRTGDTEQRMNDLERHLVTLFPHASCMERFEERAQYKIPKQDVTSLGDTFSALELIKESQGVEEYGFSQSTLEQVFLDFAKMQQDEGADIDQMNLHGKMERQLSAGDSNSVYFRM